MQAFCDCYNYSFSTSETALLIFFTCVLKIVLKLVVTVNMKFLFPWQVSRNQLHKAHNWAQSVEYDILEYMFVLKCM